MVGAPVKEFLLLLDIVGRLLLPSLRSNITLHMHIKVRIEDESDNAIGLNAVINER